MPRAGPIDQGNPGDPTDVLSGSAFKCPSVESTTNPNRSSTSSDSGTIGHVRKWFLTARRATKEASQDRITTCAASLAFHWFLALFPAAIAALGVIGLVGLSPAELRGLVHGVGVLLPTQMSQAIDESLRNPTKGAGSGIEIGVGLVVALWSLVEAMASLQVGLDVAYEVSKDRGFMGRRVRSLPLIALTILLGGSASVLLVLGNPIRSLLPASIPFAGSALNGAWIAIRWVGALILVMLLLSAFYSVAPNHDRPHHLRVSAGAVVAAIGWMAASAGFSFYLDHFGHESRTYGTFAGVAALLLWLFVTAVAVLLGAELNCEIERANR